MRIAVLLACAGCIPLLPEVDDPCAVWEEPGLYRIKVDPSDSASRDAMVYVPKSDGPRDVVVAMHGGGMNGQEIAESMKLIPAADQEGFVAVFPEGKKGTLLGLRYWSAWEERTRKNDKEYLRRVTSSTRRQLCGDRVLGIGFSNGGMMGHRWACEGSGLDALVSAAGPLMSNPNDCVGDPVPVRHYHGTDDPTVPIDGGTGNGTLATDYRSAKDTMAIWRDRNGCTDAPPEVTVDGDTTCESWDCVVSTELCTVSGFEHRWPGGRQSSLTDADATRESLSWFDRSVPR